MLTLIVTSWLKAERLVLFSCPIYEQKGGKVHWFGKPVPDFYHWVESKIPHTLTAGLAIGDSLMTDIQGANDQKIPCAMICNTGIHQESFVDGMSEEEVVQAIRNLSNELGVKMPTYALPALA